MLAYAIVMSCAAESAYAERALSWTYEALVGTSAIDEGEEKAQAM